EVPGRRSVREHSRRAAGRARGPGCKPPRHHRSCDRLPRLSVFAGRPGSDRAQLLPSASRLRRREIQVPVPVGADVHDRRGVWRMVRRAEEILRRRRGLRPDSTGRMMKGASRRVLPGFGLTLGFTIAYLSVIVLIPLSTIFFRSAALGPADFWAVISAPRTLAACRLSFMAAFAAAMINCVFGLAVAWTLVRYEFPMRGIVDAMVDLPFALPTSVAGITLTAIYASNGWIGRWFVPLGIVAALTFVGLPFVVRTVQPVLEEIDLELEEAAATLGANRLQTFARVTLPTLMPAVLTGFTLAFARAIGEYGSVVFISGNLPMKTEVLPLLIMSKLEQFDYGGATAIGVLMLAISFVLLYGVNSIQKWSARRLAA